VPRVSPACAILAFCSGNTFAAIGRTLIQDLLKRTPPVKAHTFRSVVGHYIAGTAGANELGKVLDDLN